ncbi:Putative ribosomal N-acetyltransferase YdaF [Marinomonas spartinae]|uniref:GNAT family N-acetyltransferase n=1 Tax=Marinomonas spartinae TaxID=1792290 RepID=UPI000808E977|nr:GNAT family N-acetyltransferase [Marinomonas spartinae]SBS34950.1 Putative ribosomal N-acetyltransferase YdaF [Marinomonas spartinae]
MELRLLSESDLHSLLSFEIGNRQWFEAYIDPRAETFYSVDGVREHITECLSLYRSQEMLPMLIVDGGGEIVGRINLRDIDMQNRSAYLGYRIGEAFTNRGLAKRAVKELIAQIAHLNLKALIAYVSADNIASQKVLQHNGFLPIKNHEDYVVIKGIFVDCIEYHHSL